MHLVLPRSLGPGAGVRRQQGARHFFRVDQHFADWQLTDQVSGRTGAGDDYLAFLAPRPWWSRLGFGGGELASRSTLITRRTTMVK